MADQTEEYSRPPVISRPQKDINIFICDEDIGAFPTEIFAGKLGPLPILMSVSVGYDPEDRDPFMYHYESQEVLFAYKEDAQKRVLMVDGCGRTLSLPLHSTLLFCLATSDPTSRRLPTEPLDAQASTVAQLVSSGPLPVTIQFAQHTDFIVDKRAVNHRFFGSPITVTAVYDEPFMWCLPVQPNGTPGDRPIVLPRNLNSAGFCPVVGIRGASDPAAKVKDFLRLYSQAASQLQFQGDPFFQELGFVSRGPEPVEKVEPYIDHTTFIPICSPRRPPPPEPPGECPPPLPPPRTRLMEQSSEEEESGDMYYCSITPKDADQHLYIDIGFSTFQSKDSDDGNQPLPVETGRSLNSLQEKSPQDPEERPPVPARVKSSGSDVQVPPRHGNVDLMASPVMPDRAVRPHLSSLSVEDVGDKLKELGLEKYAKKFRKNRIDGVLLQKLKEGDFKSEFRMTHVEFLRLNTFITDGHIPDTAKSATGKKSRP